MLRFAIKSDELRVTAGRETVALNNPASPVTVSVPYTPSPAELANPEHIVLWDIAVKTMSYEFQIVSTM